MDNKVKNVLLLVLVIGLVGMTSAYALLSQNLQISSSATVTGGSWDVYIDNFSGPHYSSSRYGNTSASTGATATAAASVTKTPTVKTTSISGIEVSFSKPKVEIYYSFKLVNAGTIDAKLDSYSLSGITQTNNGQLIATGSDANTTITCHGTASDSTQAAADAALVCSHIKVTLYSENYEGMSLPKQTSIPTSVDQDLKIELTDMDTLPSADVTVSGINLSYTFIQA